MTALPQFTAEELRMIYDALTVHAGHITKLYVGRMDTETLVRLSKIRDLGRKAAELAKQGDDDGNVRPDVPADEGRPRPDHAGDEL